MKTITGFFDNLHFTESIFGDAILDGVKLTIPVTNILLLAGHPLVADGLHPYGGELIFDGVAGSHCTLREYIGDSYNPLGSKEPILIVQKTSSKEILTSEALQSFVFEGFQETTNSWIIEWVVLAESFSLKVLNKH
jgi:hypothetical protein